MIHLSTLSETFANRIEADLARTKPISADEMTTEQTRIRLDQTIVDCSLILRNKLLISQLYEHYDALPEPVRRRLRFERDVMQSFWEKYAAPQAGSREVELQAMTIGKLLLVAHPSEFFTATTRKSNGGCTRARCS